MEKLNKTEILRLVKEFNEIKNKKNHTEAIKITSKKLDKFYEQKAVLGFDIYQYSQFQKLQQTLIPYLFKKLMYMTIINCINYEAYIFQKTTAKKIKENFIDSGDGGFIIFETPFHALIFAIYFETNIKRYNSGHTSTQNIRNIIGEINLRYSLTYDDIYLTDDNFYGSSIINCSRIMSKDKLNRFLLDNNTIQWFNTNINGIESIQVIDFKKNDHKEIKLFSEYIKKTNKNKSLSLLFASNSTSIIRSDIMHIGKIKSKSDKLDIYSSHIQARFDSHGKTNFSKMIISLGNLNSNGISK